MKCNNSIYTNLFIYSQDEGAERSGGGKDVVFQRFGSHHRKIIPKHFFWPMMEFLTDLNFRLRFFLRIFEDPGNRLGWTNWMMHETQTFTNVFRAKKGKNRHPIVNNIVVAKYS
jgi:hypothetical protein